MRRTVPLLAFAVASAVCSVAYADGNCPPGSWFCADVTVPGPAPSDAAPAPPPGEKGETKKATEGGTTKSVTQTEGATTTTTTTVVPNSGGGTTVIVNTAPPADAHPAPPPPPPRRVVPPPPPPRYEPPPPPPPPRHPRSEWGFNAHLEGAMMDKQRAQNAGMGGIGFALRARPTPHFAIDLGLDFVGGTDYLGHKRNEVPFTVNALLFVNPRSKVQVYFLGGLGWSSAEVQIAQGDTEHYGYFGLQGGAGLEFRVGRKVGIDVDMLGFVRGRTDSLAQTKPEFVDATTGRTTNTSGGGLMRAGLTIYW